MSGRLRKDSTFVLRPGNLSLKEMAPDVGVGNVDGWIGRRERHDSTSESYSDPKRRMESADKKVHVHGAGGKFLPDERKS